MSKKKEDKKEVEKVVAYESPATTTEPQEPVFFLYELREHCHELFGVSPEVYDGALFNCNKPQISKLEAQQRVNTYLTRKLDQGVRT